MPRDLRLVRQQWRSSAGAQCPSHTCPDLRGWPGAALLEIRVTSVGHTGSDNRPGNGLTAMFNGFLDPRPSIGGNHGPLYAGSNPR